MSGQMKKNTVSSQNQLPQNQSIVFEGSEEADIRAAFVGNSITLHGEKPEIGWLHRFGMAASKKENDYVHLVIRGLREAYGTVRACICNAAEWERAYRTGETVLEKFRQVRDFQPDILVMRVIENCPAAEFDIEKFGAEYEKLADYLTGAHTKVVFTTGFWKHPGDRAIMEAAKKKNCPCVYLGDLGEMDEMKAIGLFSHTGVAQHPGDRGMQKIAERILAEIR